MHILIADNDYKMRELIREQARMEGIHVSEASNGVQAVEFCRSHDYDAVVMDAVMPKLDGFAACLEIKKDKDVPIVMLSGMDDENHKLLGFRLGIEDYVVKPCSLKELMARLNVIFRRNSRSNLKPKEDKAIFEGLEIDFLGRKVVVDGLAATMTPKEYNLLTFLVRNKNIAMSREQILQSVWGYDFFGDDRTVDVHIKMLRSHLQDYRKYIVTVRSMGYKFEA